VKLTYSVISPLAHVGSNLTRAAKQHPKNFLILDASEPSDASDACDTSDASDACDTSDASDACDPYDISYASVIREITEAYELSYASVMSVLSDTICFPNRFCLTAVTPSIRWHRTCAIGYNYVERGAPPTPSAAREDHLMKVCSACNVPMDNDSPFNLCGLCDPNSEINSPAPSVTEALGVAIAALTTYGSIVNGQNVYASEIETLAALRMLLRENNSL
jgi:hypothetical protein